MQNKPWLPYLAVEYIKRLNPHRVLEWGSGESTLFFLRHLAVEYVVSIEHDEEWFEKVNQMLSDKYISFLSHCRFIPYEPGSLGNDPSNPTHYKSGSTNLGDVNFRRYASAIDDYGLFDLILVDGMARASCIYHAFKHVAAGGCMVIDNTGDRPYYLEKTVSLFGNYEDGWERVDFMGYGPILDYKWQTTFFINRVKENYESTK